MLLQRAAGSTVVEAPTSDALDDIFAGFGGASVSPTEPVKDQKPVISQNVSTFTVVVEFIQVTLPADKNV